MAWSAAQKFAHRASCLKPDCWCRHKGSQTRKARRPPAFLDSEGKEMLGWKIELTPAITRHKILVTSRLSSEAGVALSAIYDTLRSISKTSTPVALSDTNAFPPSGGAEVNVVSLVRSVDTQAQAPETGATAVIRVAGNWACVPYAIAATSLFDEAVSGFTHTFGGRTRPTIEYLFRMIAGWPGPAVFIDGEAYEDGSYSVLQTFDPRDGSVYTTRAPEGRLSSAQCFEHLFLHPKANIFGYGLRYDISNWLADVSPQTLTVLLKNGHAKWGSTWNLHLIPGKVLKVTDFTRPKGDRMRSVWDLHPFFQQGFIGALETAEIEVPDIIRLGKRLRGRFSRTNSEFVEAYNEAELRTMAELHGLLCRTLEAGQAKIRSWFGPGSIARFKASENGVSVAPDEQASFLSMRQDTSNAGLEDEATIIARSQSPHACVVDAFFGGRFELSQHGPIDACWEYDLSSAYPWALSTGMPCFACGGRWVHGEGLGGSPWEVVLTDWQPVNSPNGLSRTSPEGYNRPMWGPLPVRVTRNLAWPRAGIGWYHRCEVEAAKQHLSHLYQFRTFEGWSWHPNCNHDPWAWVGDVASERVACKHTDPAKAQCLKLALNSLYGITADKAGVDNGRIPRYHNPYWAGLITARTRARLLQAAAAGGEDIVYLATDGVHSKRPLDLPLGKGLGDWEPPARAGVPAVFLAPGTYLYEDGERGKSRGINIGKFSTDIDCWRRLYRMTAASGRINLKDRHFCSFVEALSRAGGEDTARYRDILNGWTTRPRQLLYDLTPRRERRPDGRWIAPDYAGWIAQSQILLSPQDRNVASQEAQSHWQPEWALHKLDEVMLNGR